MDAEQLAAELLRALKDGYAQTLGAAGAAAAVVSPSTGAEVERALTALGTEVRDAERHAQVEVADARARAILQQWSEAAEDDLRRKTADVKELLVTLAHTAASVAASDAEHVLRFDALTGRLRRIATLDDVTQLRGAVLESATELCASVEAMSRSTRAAVASMQAEVATYQARLEAAEKMVAQDTLTGLYTRHKVERLLERRMKDGRAFSVGVFALVGFAATNDRLGRAAGDDLLRQVAREFQDNLRPGDVLGRWGGAEFVVACTTADAGSRAHLERLRTKVAGRYEAKAPKGTVAVQLDLAAGITDWHAGLTTAALIAEVTRLLEAARRAR